MIPGRRLGQRQVLLTPSLSPPEGRRIVNLYDVRKLELRYSRRTPGKVDLIVEHVGGRIKVFEVDRFLIERLLEQLEDREAWTTIRLDSTNPIKQDRTSEKPQ
jgi:hypothetical protein